MKILMYGTKIYEKESFLYIKDNYPFIQLDFIDSELSFNTIELAINYDAICIFVNEELTKYIIDKLVSFNIHLVLLRCAGYNNVDVEYATSKLTILRVSAYSPEAVAEHALALALAVNRKIHKAYIKVRENNFALNGLVGINLFQKTAGIIGTGKIGLVMAKLCHGLSMNVIAYDPHPDYNHPYIKYVTLDELFHTSDLISLHCPLQADTYHIINQESIKKMKNGVILINTSRGALINSSDLINGIRSKKFFGVGLDVYEEEKNNVFTNRQDDILEQSITSRLLSFPNVIITSHQAFLTKEALISIAKITLQNAADYIHGELNDENIVTKV